MSENHVTNNVVLRRSKSQPYGENIQGLVFDHPSLPKIVTVTSAKYEKNGKQLGIPRREHYPIKGHPTFGRSHSVEAPATGNLNNYETYYKRYHRPAITIHEEQNQSKTGFWSPTEYMSPGMFPTSQFSSGKQKEIVEGFSRHYTNTARVMLPTDSTSRNKSIIRQQILSRRNSTGALRHFPEMIDHFSPNPGEQQIAHQSKDNLHGQHQKDFYKYHQKIMHSPPTPRHEELVGMPSYPTQSLRHKPISHSNSLPPRLISIDEVLATQDEKIHHSNDVSSLSSHQKKRRFSTGEMAAMTPYFSQSKYDRSRSVPGSVTTKGKSNPPLIVISDSDDNDRNNVFTDETRYPRDNSRLCRSYVGEGCVNTSVRPTSNERKFSNELLSTWTNEIHEQKEFVYVKDKTEMKRSTDDKVTLCFREKRGIKRTADDEVAVFSNQREGTYLDHKVQCKKAKTKEISDTKLETREGKTKLHDNIPKLVRLNNNNEINIRTIDDKLSAKNKQILKEQIPESLTEGVNKTRLTSLRETASITSHCDVCKDGELLKLKTDGSKIEFCFDIRCKNCGRKTRAGAADDDPIVRVPKPTGVVFGVKKSPLTLLHSKSTPIENNKVEANNDLKASLISSGTTKTSTQGITTKIVIEDNSKYKTVLNSRDRHTCSNDTPKSELEDVVLKDHVLNSHEHKTKSQADSGENNRREVLVSRSHRNFYEEMEKIKGNNVRDDSSLSARVGDYQKNVTLQEHSNVSSDERNSLAQPQMTIRENALYKKKNSEREEENKRNNSNSDFQSIKRIDTQFTAIINNTRKETPEDKITTTKNLALSQKRLSSLDMSVSLPSIIHNSNNQTTPSEHNTQSKKCSGELSLEDWTAILQGRIAQVNESIEEEITPWKTKNKRKVLDKLQKYLDKIKNTSTDPPSLFVIQKSQFFHTMKNQYELMKKVETQRKTMKDDTSEVATVENVKSIGANEKANKTKVKNKTIKTLDGIQKKPMLKKQIRKKSTKNTNR